MLKEEIFSSVPTSHVCFMSIYSGDVSTEGVFGSLDIRIVLFHISRYNLQITVSSGRFWTHTQ